MLALCFFYMLEFLISEQSVDMELELVVFGHLVSAQIATYHWHEWLHLKQPSPFPLSPNPPWSLLAFSKIEKDS